MGKVTVQHDWSSQNWLSPDAPVTESLTDAASASDLVVVGGTQTAVLTDPATASDSVSVPGSWDPDSATAVAADGERTFDGYADTTAFLNDTASWRNGADDLNADSSHMQIVNKAFSGGGLSKAVRYEWVDQGCNSVSIGRGVDPGASVTEVWMEVILAYSTNYAWCNPSCEPCAHKWIFWPVKDGGTFQGRVEIHNGGSGQQSGGSFQPSDGRKRVGTSSHPSGDIKEIAGSPTPFVLDLCDTDWHSFKSHVRIETDGVTDGIQEIAYDNDGDSNDWDVTVNPYPSGSSRIYALQFGRNKDKGQDTGTENIWISRIRWWLSDPGWTGLQG